MVWAVVVVVVVVVVWWGHNGALGWEALNKSIGNQGQVCCWND